MTDATLAPARRPTIIEPRRRSVAALVRELWAHRELLFFFVWRDVKIRYKQTALGVSWALIQPVATMVIFSIIFGRFVDVPTGGLPYPIFVYAGLLPWTYFATSLAQGSSSLVGNATLVTRVFFPRLIIPGASVTVPLVDFVLGFSVLLVLMTWYGVWPSVAIVALPAFVLLAFVTSLGVVLWLSALNVRFRDVRYAIPFLVQVWLYATPVVYPLAVLDGAWRWVFALNPMAGVVEGFRWALLDEPPPELALLLLSGGAALVVFAGGLLYFRRVERYFADVI